MDFFRIIQQEGYRIEDLPEKYQFAIKCMTMLQQDFEDNFEPDFDDEMSETVAQIKSEIIEWAKAEAVQWMKVQIAEYQAVFAEEDVRNEIE